MCSKEEYFDKLVSAIRKLFLQKNSFIIIFFSKKLRVKHTYGTSGAQQTRLTEH
jgi:hypothetical protein